MRYLITIVEMSSKLYKRVNNYRNGGMGTGMGWICIYSSLSLIKKVGY